MDPSLLCTGGGASCVLVACAGGSGRAETDEAFWDCKSEGADNPKPQAQLRVGV